MPRVKFIAADGTQYVVEAPAGTSVMRAALDNGILGIDGDCGGLCACATCHVYIEAGWAPVVPEMGSQERDMLELAYEVQPSSRLGCQIELTVDADGLEVHLPKYQQ